LRLEKESQTKIKEGFLYKPFNGLLLENSMGSKNSIKLNVFGGRQKEVVDEDVNCRVSSNSSKDEEELLSYNLWKKHVNPLEKKKKSFYQS
jgi:hypothetical protein